MKNNRWRIKRTLWLVLIALLFLAGCGAGTPQSWQALETAPEPASWAQLQAVWDNQANVQSPEIRLIFESYCRTQECKAFLQKTLPWASSLSNARVKLYDVPFSQEGKSTQFAAIGRCIAQEDPARYLTFLEKSQEISNAYDNNVEMQALSKSIIGKYDSGCINQQARLLKQVFENAPAGLKQVPAIWIDGRIYYGTLTAEEVQKILASISSK